MDDLPQKSYRSAVAMSAMPSKFSAKYSVWKCKFSFFVLTLVFCASSAWAAAPAVVVDAQQTLGNGYNTPNSVAVSKNGTVFIANSGTNQVLALTPALPALGTNTPVATGTYVLVNPQALALDANGDLFIGDSPTTGGRIIEVLGDGKGNLTATVNLIFSGAPLVNPISLAVDSTGTLFIGDYPSSGGLIYSLASGGAPTLLTITGPPATLTPGALVRDSSTNLYFADNGTGNPGTGGVYVVADTGGAAQPVSSELFPAFGQPGGLALDAAGDLYILTQLGSGTGFNPGYQVVVIPAASPTTPYIIPNSGIGNPSGLAFDPLGNLDLVDQASGSAFQLAYVSPVNMGKIAVATQGTPIVFNFEFNAPAHLGGFRVVTQGDVTTEVVQLGPGGTCVNGQHTNLPGGGPTISPYFPYTCKENFAGAPAYAGIRSSVIQVKGLNTAILASMPVYETGLEGVQVTYPLNVNTTAINLQEPEALAISGQDKQVYVADFEAGVVYVAAGLDGADLTKVSTGTIVLQAPSALALDGAGNLYIADFNLGELIEVPTKTGQAPAVVNTGGLLQHPIALAFDQLGNLFIGDAGSGGQGATSGNPGYLVKIPAGGAPFKMTIPAVEIVFPQALATDPDTAALLIGDGGDLSGVGQVVQLSADGTTATVDPIDGVTNPTGLVYDQAEDFYVLDGTANTVTVVPPASSGFAPHLMEFANTTLVGASAMANSAGGQGFVIASVGQGTTNNLLHVNGNSSTLKFGSVTVGTPSQPLTATEYNIGNSPMMMQTPFYTVIKPNAAYTILGSSSCDGSPTINPSGSCTINVQFTPKFVGYSTSQVKIDSTAYNTATPTLGFQGTGTNGGAVKPKTKTK
jgi:sugar lactone lactonase YvrE